MIIIFQCTLHCAINQTHNLILEYNVQSNKLDDVLVTAQSMCLLKFFAVVGGCLLGKSEIADSNPTLASKFQRN